MIGRAPGRRHSGAGALLPALLLAGGVWVGCGEEAPPVEAAPPLVKVLVLGGEGAGRTLEYAGQVQAALRSELGFEVEGQLVAFPVEEGQRVEAGQELARIDPRDYESRMDGVTALHRQAKTELERQQALFDADVASRQELELAQRNYDVSESRFREAQKTLGDTVLRAPFAGVVARKLVSDFRNVRAKEKVLILENDAELEIVANVPERDWALSRPGLSPEERSARARAQVIVSAYPDRLFPARLTEVATTADPATRTYAVTLAFDKATDVNVMPGMTAKVRLHVPDEIAAAGYAVPARAVVDDGTSPPFVWLVDAEAMTVSKNPVTLGELSGDHVEVRQGLGAGDQVAVSGVHQLRPGMRVRRLQE